MGLGQRCITKGGVWLEVKGGAFAWTLNWAFKKSHTQYTSFGLWTTEIPPPQKKRRPSAPWFLDILVRTHHFLIAAELMVQKRCRRSTPWLLEGAPPAGNPAVCPAGTPRAAIHTTKEIPHKTTRPRGRPRGQPAGTARGGGTLLDITSAKTRRGGSWPRG